MICQIQFNYKCSHFSKELASNSTYGLEAAFQVPMPGDSGSSPNAGSFKLLLDPGDFHSNPSGLLSFNKSETVLWTIAKKKKKKKSIA